MAKLTPQAARLMARIDANQTVVRQRSEIIARREVNGELLWHSEGLEHLGLEVHHAVLRRHKKMVERDTAMLRAIGWQSPRYAMPGVVINRGVKVTLSSLRNNDAHLWDDMIAADRKLR